MPEPTYLVIRSEEDAWHWLERATRGDLPDDIQLRFDGWPTMFLDVSGRDWHSTVPTRIMPSLLDLQRDLNRAYASVRYQEANLRRLRDEEKDDLEVVVKVGPGSSKFSADLWGQLGKIAEAAVGRMSGTEITITVLGLALSVVSAVMFRQWLAARKEERQAQAQIELSQQETERLRVITEAMRQQPDLRAISADVDATRNRLLKATKPGDVMAVADVPVTSDEAREIVQPERERAREVEIEGEFVVLGNRTDKGDGFRISVRRVGDGLTLTADVPLALDYAQQQIIQRAEWSKGRVRLSIEAEMLRETFARGTVVQAIEVVPQGDATPPQGDVA